MRAFFLSNVCGWFAIKLPFYKCEHMHTLCVWCLRVATAFWYNFNGDCDRAFIGKRQPYFRWNFVSIYRVCGIQCILARSEERTTNNTHQIGQLDSCDTLTQSCLIRHTSFGSRIKATTGPSTSNFSVELKTQFLPSSSLFRSPARSHSRVENYNSVSF